jgi:hypothetical protein
MSRIEVLGGRDRVGVGLRNGEDRILFMKQGNGIKTNVIIVAWERNDLCMRDVDDYDRAQRGNNRERRGEKRDEMRDEMRWDEMRW